MRPQQPSRAGRHVLPPTPGEGALAAAGALALAATLIYLVLPLLYFAPSLATGPVNVQLFPGADFEATRAEASRIEGSTRIISQMQGSEAVFSVTAAVSLTNHPFLRLNIAGGRPDLRYVLFWRTADMPEQRRFAVLEGAGNGPSWHTFNDSELWQGTTLEVAVGAFGANGETPLVLHELGFYPTSRRALLGQIGSQWQAGGSWSAFSINRYLGAPLGSGPYPAALVGLWAALALACVAVWAYWRHAAGRALITAGLLALFLPWLLLDRLWQAQLDRQLILSGAVFAGKTQAEKHAADADAALHDYATHLRQRLASPDARLLLLHNSSGHQFDRLRMQFHLLPANAYNYDSRLLPPGQLRRGDYVLTLGPSPQLHYSAQDGVLSDGQHAYRAQRIDVHPLGNLYLLSGFAGAGRTP